MSSTDFSRIPNEGMLKIACLYDKLDLFICVQENFVKNRFYKKRCTAAVSTIPLLLLYGIPAILVICVISGVTVLVALILRTKNRKNAVQDEGNIFPDEHLPEEKEDKSDFENNDNK